ncbi:predicted protein [Naegleria gruberi]|uniref:Predicted protein n=1 Tax=Naegleria gruberi TaxID=5762 RepID=D2W4V9_NAEGR|nr:uncharacterized protein NAEGRDRAFT_54686 [Naegleria gruberi]EFC35893.1 predicted protein [Naegleria gruberi]|eukprot:XP_002668637.1 predicted protein [Naegleria gruberi strain NEG-M]
MGFVSNDDTQMQISVSAVETNSNLVFNNAEFIVGAVLNWKWNELAIDFADLHKTSASSLVNMTTLLDPKNNHVDNSDIFGPSPPTVFSTISQNVIPHLSQQQPSQPPLATLFTPSSSLPTSSRMTQPFGNISSFPSAPHVNIYSGAVVGGSASSSEIISNFSIPSFSGGTIPSFSSCGPTNNMIHSTTFEFQQKKYEERIAQLVQERDELAQRTDQLVLECDTLKKLNEELVKSESEAKKRTSQVEFHFKQKKRKVREALAAVWVEDEDEVCKATSFTFRGNTYSLTPIQQVEVKTIGQFGMAVDKLVEMFHLEKPPYSNNDLKELEVAAIKLTTVDAVEDQKVKKKRFDNYRQTRKKAQQKNSDSSS